VTAERARPRGRARRAAIAGWLCFGLALAAACASRQPSVSYEQIDQRKQEIAMLWGQIRGWRQDAGLRGVEPSPRAILEMRGKPMAQATRVCPQRVEPQTQRCGDVCSLADAICENADRICHIADELAGDDWADSKCSSAKASCKEARQACCNCWSEEPPASQTPASSEGAGASQGAGQSPETESSVSDTPTGEGSFFWSEHI
jgi:hypothetical protein